MVLNIISEHSEEEKIEALRPHFKERGIKLMVLYPCSAFMAKAAALKAPQAILWISTKTNPDLFDIATERNNRGLSTINYFADEVGLSESQKNAVGRNRSVFAEMNPDDNFKDLVKLFNVDSNIEIHSESEGLSREQCKEKKIKNQPFSPINNKATESTIPSPTEHATKTRTSTSDFEVDNNVETTDYDDQENSNNNRKLWMPFIWGVCSLAYYFCLLHGVIEAWSDQIWFLVLTAVFFFFAYKVVISTITAIKISKWSFVYVPFSLYILIFDLYYGFNSLGAYFD